MGRGGCWLGTGLHFGRFSDAFGVASGPAWSYRSGSAGARPKLRALGSGAVGPWRNGSVQAATRRQLASIGLGTVVFGRGQFSEIGRHIGRGVSTVANRCSQRVVQSPLVVKRHEQRGGSSTALPNKRSQATAGGTRSVNRRRRSPAAPEAQR